MKVILTAQEGDELISVLREKVKVLEKTRLRKKRLGGLRDQLRDLKFFRGIWFKLDEAYWEEQRILHKAEEVRKKKEKESK